MSRAKANTILYLVDESKPIRVSEPFAHIVAMMNSVEMFRATRVLDHGALRDVVVRGNAILLAEKA